MTREKRRLFFKSSLPHFLKVDVLEHCRRNECVDYNMQQARCCTPYRAMFKWSSLCSEQLNHTSTIRTATAEEVRWETIATVMPTLYMCRNPQSMAPSVALIASGNSVVKVATTLVTTIPVPQYPICVIPMPISHLSSHGYNYGLSPFKLDDGTILDSSLRPLQFYDLCSVQRTY